MQKRETPPMFRSLPAPAGLEPFVRRIMISHHSRDVEVTVRPAPTGFNYIGWIYAGQAECDFGSHVDTVTSSGLNYAGQVLSPHLSMRFTGAYGHVLAETTATGFAELTHVPGEAVADKAGLFDTAQHPWAADFAAQTAALPADLDPEARVEIMATALKGLARAQTPAPDYIKSAAEQMVSSSGLARIADLAESSDVGARHFTREFTRIVGVSPKLFCLIQQVNQAIALWQDGDIVSLTELAHAAGYYDQPHLNRSFNKFFSESPGKVLFDPHDVVFEFLGRGVDQPADEVGGD